MRQSLIEFVDRLHNAVTVGEVERLLVDWCRNMGFGRTVFGYLPAGQGAEPLLIGSYPQAWVSRYLEENYIRTDPVVERGMRNVVPFSWGFAEDRCTYTPPQLKLFDEADEFGISRGISVPVHGPEHSLSILSMATDEADQGFQKLVALNQNTVHLGCCYVHQRLLELVKPEDVAVMELSPREAECLLWAATGKAEPEIGEILNIAARTVAYHLAQVKQKLGVRTNAEAVAKALVKRMISL